MVHADRAPWALILMVGSMAVSAQPADLEARPAGAPAVAPAIRAPAGASLNQEGIDELVRGIREAQTREQQTVARAQMAPPAEACGRGAGGMIRDPLSCITASRARGREGAASERDTILGLLAQAEASLDADLAALPGGQIQRFKAMEALNDKYRSITTFTRGTTRGQGSKDPALRAACERFERKRLAATDGQEAVSSSGSRKAARAAAP